MSDILNLNIIDFTTSNGTWFKQIKLSYQLFGEKLGTAPVVLVNHALTGNSNVSGENGWWSNIIGSKKVINTDNFTVLAFNIPGNGFDGFLIENYRDFVAKDVAKLFLKGLRELKIEKLFALIGGSLGGGIAWEMAALHTEIAEHLIPIASDYKATDWLIANCKIQEQFLLNSSNPISDARMHAMLCYRAPLSFKVKFRRTKKENTSIFNIESWLIHHGKKLQERFQLSAYKLMNQLLKTIDATAEKGCITSLSNINSEIHLITISSDLFFISDENKETYKALKTTNKITYNEIESIHGHDAFLMEYKQLEKILSPIFKKETVWKHKQLVKVL